MDLFFGTTNPGKLRELRRLVAGLPIRVVSPQDLGRPMPEVEEDGRTFAENAATDEEPGPEPASPVCEFPGAAADELGPIAGGAARDERNNDKLLRSLEGVPGERRGAQYQAVLALARADGTIVASVSGSCRGRIGLERRGTGGFGYDPLFLPEGQGGCTMSELSPDEKDAVSHRGEAFRRLRPVLERLALP